MSCGLCAFQRPQSKNESKNKFVKVRGRLVMKWSEAKDRSSDCITAATLSGTGVGLKTPLPRALP